MKIMLLLILSINFAITNSLKGFDHAEIDINVQAVEGGVTINLVPNEDLGYSHIFNINHHDYPYILKFEDELSSHNLEFKKTSLNGEVEYTVSNSIRTSPSHTINQNSKMYHFYDLFDAFIMDLTDLSNRRATLESFEVTPSLLMPAIEISLERGEMPDAAYHFFKGRFVYCTLPTIEGLKIPSWISSLIQLRCSETGLPESLESLIKNDLKNIRLSITDTNYLNRNLEKPNVQYISFNEIGNGLCEPFAGAEVIQGIVQDYKEAGWVDDFEGSSSAIFSAYCRKFVLYNLLPKLMDSIIKSAKNNDHELNYITKSIITQLVKSNTSRDRNSSDIVNTIENILVKLFNKNISDALELLNQFDDLRIYSHYDEFETNLEISQFENIIKKLIFEPFNGFYTPFQSKAIELNEREKSILIEIFIKVLSSDCSVGISFDCVNTSKTKMGKYSINIFKDDILTTKFTSIGSILGDF